MNSNVNQKPRGREAALARRRAQSSMGKKGATANTRERTRAASAATRTEPAPQPVPKPRPRPRTAPERRLEPAPSRPAGRPDAGARIQQAAAVSSPSQQSRSRAMARRQALSRAGRPAAKTKDRVRSTDPAEHSSRKAEAASPNGKTCECGCKGRKDTERQDPGAKAPERPARRSLKATNGARSADNHQHSSRSRRQNGHGGKSTGRLVAQARRTALSSRGKAAGDTPTSAASLARQANPKLSGRELAQRVRAQRSHNGGAGERKTQSAGRIRAERRYGSTDQPWKVGASETAAGQTVTGTRVGRSTRTTGDEPSTCRPITGTEYLGAEIFREFCQAEPARGTQKVGISATGHGNRVTGNEVGRSTRVTGDEPGTCKSVTGTEYLSPQQQDAFCGFHPEAGPRKVGQAQTSSGQRLSGTQVGRSIKVTGDEQGAGVQPTGTQYTNVQSIQNGQVATGTERGPVPQKVGTSTTLSGGTVTGTRVGRSVKVTGDEPGSCRQITGDEYADLDQYQGFCTSTPQAEPAKVGYSRTSKRQTVSGTQTGRSKKVTGDEPGTCKAITGTPYAGLEQAAEYCAPDAQQTIQARSRQLAGTPGPSMTGIQPGIGGVMTGNAKGACEPVTGTPYVGQDQYAEACDGEFSAPGPGDADFPQLLDSDTAPWAQFSVVSPARQAFQESKAKHGVTGTRYETGNQITGPFDMGVGKITGTEQFRFGAKHQKPQDLMHPEGQSQAKERAAQETANEAPPRPRITGEGQSAGPKITGDDWNRGDRVTGTEGTSALRRNPTRPGPMTAMPPTERKRNEEIPAPVSRVTGSSGNTGRGALVTYSGGARG